MENSCSVDTALATADVRRRPWTWAWRLAAFAAMLAAGATYRSGGLTDPDSWDYAAQAILRQSSDLALGRWWFIAAMRAAWLVGQRLFGLSTPEAYMPMQVASALMMGGAVVAGMAWTRRITGSAAAEVVFAAMAVTGPLVGVYTFSVMTEGMTLLFLSLALWAWEVARAPGPWPRLDGGCAKAAIGHQSRHRAGPPPEATPAEVPTTPDRAILWAFAAGLAFGVAVDVREPVILVAAWPVLSCIFNRRAGQGRLLIWAGAGAACTLLAGVLRAWAWYPWKLGAYAAGMDVSYFAGVRRWLWHMDREGRTYPLSLPLNLVNLFKCGLANVPAATLVALPAALWAAWRFRKGALLAAALVPLAIATAIDTTLDLNPRHPLPLMWLLGPLAAAAICTWAAAIVSGPHRQLAAALLGVLAASASVLAFAHLSGILRDKYYGYVSDTQSAYHALRKLPWGASVAAGPVTPAASFLNRQKEKGFDIVPGGWGRPDDLAAEIHRRMRDGNSLYVCLEEAAWKRTVRKSDEWDELQRAVAPYRLGEQVGPFRKLEPPPPADDPATGPPPLP